MMATTRAYGDIHTDGSAPVVIGDYQPITHIHYGQQRENIDTVLLESLTFQRWDARLRNIVPALDQTCEWIFSHPHFKAWQESGQTALGGSFLWLKGKPGSGKSTVMKKVVEWAQRDKSDYILLSYFFNARSPQELEKSSLGLYRSLTYQLLSTCPDAISTFVQMFFGKTQSGRMSEEWTVAELQSFWLQLVARQKLPSCFVFIDALDEGSEDDVQGMIEHMTDLVDMSSQNDNTILIFLSSRYYPTITIEKSLPVFMEEQGGHQDDIRLYLSKKLKGGASQGVDELRQLVFNRSQGVFLWVILVVSILNRWYDQGHTTHVRMKKLETVPVSLHDIFDQILFGNTCDSTSSSDSQDMQECIFLFRWVLFSLRPLRPDELSKAIQTSIMTVEQDDALVEADEDDSKNAEMVERRLMYLSRGLVELTTFISERDGVVQLIHETVRDFLMGKTSTKTSIDRRSTIRRQFMTHFDVNACHCAIAKTCLSRLIAVASRLTVSWEQDILAAYAAEYWWQHVQAVSGDTDEEVLQLATELCLTPSYLYTWVQNHNVDRPWYHQGYDISLEPDEVATPLYYAAFIGYKQLIDVILNKEPDVNTLRGHYGNALQAASLKGHERVVQILLDNGADVNAQGGRYGNALQAASYSGDKSTVQTLLDNGADVNAQGGYFGNTLQAASAAGYETVVQILLDNGADVNAQGGEYGNALQASSHSGEETIVQMLLDNGADVNAQGGEYGNALQAASANREKTIVQMLLDKGADVNAQGGKYGNALQAASANGEKTIVQMLLDKGADVNAQGGKYGNALQAASFEGEETIVQILLDKGADVNAQGGKYGNALQAASARGNESVVQILRKAGALWLES